MGMNACRFRRTAGFATVLTLLAVASLTLHAEDPAAPTYDLRGPIAWEGHTYRMTSAFTLTDNQFSADVRGQKIQLLQNANKAESRRVEVLAMDGIQPIDARITVLESEDIMTMSAGDQIVQQEENPSPLVGRTVRVRRNGDSPEADYNYELLGGTPDSEQIAAMEELAPDRDPAAAFPEEPVPVGHTWEIDGARFREMLDMQDENVSGSARLTLIDVESVDGHDIATVDIQLTISGSAADDNDENFKGNMQMQLSGTIRRNITLSIDEQVSLDGTLTVQVQLFEDGTNIGSIGSTGPMSLRQSQARER